MKPAQPPASFVETAAFTIECPWCHQPFVVAVEIGVINYRANGGHATPRTGITSRRKETRYHDCIDARAPR